MKFVGIFLACLLIGGAVTTYVLQEALQRFFADVPDYEPPRPSADCRDDLNRLPSRRRELLMAPIEWRQHAEHYATLIAASPSLETMLKSTPMSSASQQNPDLSALFDPDAGSEDKLFALRAVYQRERGALARGETARVLLDRLCAQLAAGAYRGP